MENLIVQKKNRKINNLFSSNRKNVMRIDKNGEETTKLFLTDNSLLTA